MVECKIQCVGDLESRDMSRAVKWLLRMKGRSALYLRWDAATSILWPTISFNRFSPVLW
jgi:hypothetical protein